ncbi:MAG: DUF2852 domain-containing protein [Paracoccaceae bacterium]
MNTTTFSNFSDNLRPNKTATYSRQNEPHLVVQILSVIAFGVFSIVAISLAFATFWVAGLVLAIVIATTWARTRTFGGQRSNPDTTADYSIDELAPTISPMRSSGNSSFDAYRSEMLQRLEQENLEFRDFLTRLSEASDAKEFDQFMDDRAAKAKISSAVPKIKIKS